MENYNYFGLSWSKKSCWIDSSLMALFFSDRTYSVFYPFVSRNESSELSRIRDETEKVISNIRSANTVASINKLRTLLNRYAHQKNDSELIKAFEQEDVEGYVYYFIVQFLKLFNVKPIQGKYQDGEIEESYILELENCNGTTIQECLMNGYSDWSWKHSDYLIIEMVNSTLLPQEEINWQNKSYSLESMVVYNCSHFITYVKKNGHWFLYDDSRTLYGDPIKKYKFGEHYVNTCSFSYGQTNTFFFYIISE